MNASKIGLLCGVLLAMLVAQPGHAASKYWSHGGSDNLWTNGANWTDGIVPTSGDIIYLANNCPDAPQTILIDSSVTISNIECTATGNRNYTIDSSNGATITIIRPGYAIRGTRSVDLTINANIISPDAANNFYVYRDGNNVTLNGNVTLDSSRALFSMDAGTLVLSGSNSCSAVRHYDTGTIVSRHWHSLGDGYLQNNTANATLLLKTNTSVLGTTSTAMSMLQPFNIGITDTGTNDITLTVMGGFSGERITTLPGANGSTGRLYIRSKYTSNHTAEWTLDENTSLVLANDSGNMGIGINAANAETGSISGAGSVIVESGNQVYFFATNDYTGGTIIRTGTLTIRGDDRLPTNGTVTVESAGTLLLYGKSQTVSNLTGNGIVQFNNASPRGTNIVTGTLAPGLNGRGTLTYTSAGVLTLTSSTVCEFELGATNEVNDKVVMAHSAANITLAGKLKIIRCPGLDRGKYTLVDMSGATPAGSFDSLEMPPLYRGTVAVEGGDVVLTVTTAPPWGTVFSFR